MSREAYFQSTAGFAISPSGLFIILIRILPPWLSIAILVCDTRMTRRKSRAKYLNVADIGADILFIFLDVNPNAYFQIINFENGFDAEEKNWKFLRIMTDFEKIVQQISRITQMWQLWIYEWINWV